NLKTSDIGVISACVGETLKTSEFDNVGLSNFDVGIKADVVDIKFKK
ncbi:4901_t:CDS:1, partial [Gigaspora rosea]